MTNTQTISWIFLAIAIASSTKTADINAITDIADGINHAIPTQDELQNSISFLTNKAFIIKEGNGYKLTANGSLAYKNASKSNAGLIAICVNLEITISTMI